MDTKSIWDLLSSIPVGVIVAWIVVICAIITALCTGTIKLYKLFSKYREAKDRNEQYKKASKEHEEKLEEVSQKLDKIYEEIEKQRLINYKQVRFSIVHTCNEAISEGKITASKYKSLMEMYDEYITVFADMKPNGYVHKLVQKVDDPDYVKIVGKLEE